jgi:hypothetical protein
MMSRDCCETPGHHRPPAARAGWWALLAPLLACAVCPACVTLYAQVLSVIGLGFELGTQTHEVLLFVAVALAGGVAFARFLRLGRLAPFAVTLAGCGLVVGGHVADVHALEWSGVALLVAGGVVEQLAARRRAAPVCSV